MILVFGRPIPFDGMHVSPVARHISGVAHWRDTLSYDATLVMSEIEIDLPAEVMDALTSDRDVLHIVDLDPETPEPGPESGDSGERNMDKKISEVGWGNIVIGAKRFGIPEAMIDADMTYDMVVGVFRQKMIVDQALGEYSLDDPRKAADRIKDRLEQAGIKIEIDVPSRDELLEKSLKKEHVKRGNPRKR